MRDFDEEMKKSESVLKIWVKLKIEKIKNALDCARRNMMYFTYIKISENSLKSEKFAFPVFWHGYKETIDLQN